MKKLIFILLAICALVKVNAQTGIGTSTPNASAKLDVSATNKGFLPPRVALTATNLFAPLTGLSGSDALATAAGLLVYNITSNSNVTPGYYYWNGISWIQISNGLIIDNSKSAGFTLSAADNNKVFLITSSSAITVIVPNTLPIGFSCQIIQGGSGTITMAGSSVVLNSSNGFTTRATNSVIGLVMNTVSNGYVFGDSIF